ncbi:MAG: hypothetical protein GX594_17295 [Pirellulaceae bacterium]|nr:hypothetical protein [Pirellulaceae bacterium]
MIRKTVFIGSGVVLLSVLLFGRDAYSYLRTSLGYVTGAAAEAVPIEFEIDRARGMVEDLVPEVRKNMHIIAKEEVEVARLEEQIAQWKARLEKEKEQIMRLNADLSTGRNVFTYASRNYTADDVRTDLAGRFERYKTGEATMASLEEMRNARDKSLTAARRKLEGMLASKRQLQVEVENLEARLQMIAAAESTSEFQFDDSRLGRVKELVVKLRSRLDVAEKMVQAEVNFHDEIPLDQAAPADIVDQVTEYFAPAAPKAIEVAKQ